MIDHLLNEFHFQLIQWQGEPCLSFFVISSRSSQTRIHPTKKVSREEGAARRCWFVNNAERNFWNAWLPLGFRTLRQERRTTMSINNGSGKQKFRLTDMTTRWLCMPLPTESARGFPLIGPAGCAQESAMTASVETPRIPVVPMFRSLDLDSAGYVLAEYSQRDQFPSRIMGIPELSGTGIAVTWSAMKR